MSLETELFARLGPLTAGAVYPDIAPSGAVPPYIVWQQVGGEAPGYVDNLLPDARHAEVQIESWATTRAAANALALLIEQTLVEGSNAALTGRAVGAFVAAYSEDDGRRGTRQDFSLWAQR